MAMLNNHRELFLWAIYTMAMLNNQRVAVLSLKQTIQSCPRAGPWGGNRFARCQDMGHHPNEEKVDESLAGSKGVKR